MDKIFMEFEEWYLNKTSKWQQTGIIVDEVGLGKYGHQYWIKLHAENGMGNIILYESNGYYWVDFEAANIAYDDMFLKGGIEFNSMSDLDTYEKEFIDYILY
ncbi:MAG: hypothetical protein J1E01_06915 [Acetatifactor sp.]|nr:hypothetical protein [Acetatifactor sp.]